MIANDVVETIGELAEEWSNSTAAEILIGLGLAPDEVTRMAAVAAWATDRLRGSIAAAIVDGFPGVVGETEIQAACWTDGFIAGLAVARRPR